MRQLLAKAAAAAVSKSGPRSAEGHKKRSLHVLLPTRASRQLHWTSEAQISSRAAAAAAAAAYLEKTTRSSFRQSVADDDDGVAGRATLLASILAPGLWMTLQGRRGDD